MKRILHPVIALSLLVCCASPTAAAYGGDKETEFFLKAKECVFERNWEEAQNRLEAYLDKYPSGRFEEEARYWLARSLYKQAGEEKQADAVIRLGELAVENLDRLLQKHDEGLWADDATALRIEIVGALAVLGLERHKKYIEEILLDQDVRRSELVTAALETLGKLEPEAALPLLEQVLNSQRDPAIRKQAVQVVGAFFGEEGLDLLRHVENSDPDEAVRQEATVCRKRIQMESIPVELNYFGYTAELKSNHHLIPEGELNSYDFPALETQSKRKIEKEVEKLFDGKLTDVKFATSVTSDLDLQKELSREGLQMRVSHNLHGFLIEIPKDSVQREYFEIRAKASFVDTYRDREYLKDFVVDETQGRLLAMRSGDRVAILVLQFESLEEPLEISGEPVYETKCNNVLGAVVHSSRQSWDTEELAAISKGSIVDFGRARAEIPGDGGLWILIGDIQAHNKDRRFVGRGAVLYDPNRKIVAEGSEIIVPADDPAAFEIVGKGN